jgi:hypothetical protein
MFVRLQDSPKGPAGKWTDAATSEHGDLLDIIRESLGLRDFREVADEARRFLKLPRSEPEIVSTPMRLRVVAGSQDAARRLLAISVPIDGTIVETYLRRRGIAHVHHNGSLRFHPRCYYRPDEHLPTETWPAMIACVTDLDGRITGVHRTWLDPDSFDWVRLGKAPIDTPRRAMGDLLGNAVRFGPADDDVLVAGEGIETMLSLRCVLPTLPMAAALSAYHLAAMLLSPSLRRLPATPMPPGTQYRSLLRSAQEPQASRRLPCRHGWATSTKICTSSALTLSEQRCGFSSRLRTSTASSCPPQRPDSCICLPSTSIVPSRRIQCRQRAATTAF